MSEMTSPHDRQPKCVMKRCSCCNLEKQLSDFPVRKKTTGARYTKCRGCRHIIKARWRNSNRQLTRFYDSKRRDQRRLLVTEYLLKHPCVDCGIKDLLVLDFDHIKERGEKLFTIGYQKNRTTFSKQELFAEMSKCEVRCANCHRRKTVERNPTHWSHRYLANSPGLEPRQGESKSPVLPLHHEFIRRGRTLGVQLLLI